MSEAPNPTIEVAKALAGRYYDRFTIEWRKRSPITREEFIERAWRNRMDDAATAVQVLIKLTKDHDA